MDKEAALELALSQVAAEGMGTLSLPALAERAGVSRATMYRMFSGRDDLVARLAAREMAAMVRAGMAELDFGVATPELAGDLVLFALGYLRAHAALNRVRELEPEALLTFAIHRGTDRVNVIEMVTGYLEPVLADPRHRPRLGMPPRQAAEHLVRIVLSHFLSESRGTDDATLAAAASRGVCRIG